MACGTGPIAWKPCRKWLADRAVAIDNSLVARPQLATDERVLPAGFSMALSAPKGTVYFTLDGSDPRLPGGGLSPSVRV